jgi:hypothetical protein
VLFFQEIPVRRKTKKFLPSASSDVQPPMGAQVIEERVRSQPGPSTSLATTHTPVKAFLESCNPDLQEFLPLFIDAGIKDDSSLIALILCSRKDRLSFSTANFGNKMTLGEILVFNDNCELQSQYSA